MAKYEIFQNRFIKNENLLVFNVFFNFTYFIEENKTGLNK